MIEIVDFLVVDLDYYRNLVDEVVVFIDKEFNECYDLFLEKELNLDGIINNECVVVLIKGVVLVILVKLYVYVVSLLFNGGYFEVIVLKDN